MKNKSLKTISILAAISICILAATACKKTTGDMSKLQEIKRIAIVSVNYNRQVQNATSQNLFEIAQNAKKAFGKYPAPQKEEAQFYGNFTDKMADLIRKNLKDIQVIETSFVTSNATYLQLSENPASNPYYPTGYRKIKLNSENAKLLCEKLNTDAVMTIDYKYKLKRSGIVVVDIKYALQSDIKVFNKKGEQVAEFIALSDYIAQRTGVFLSPIEVQFDLDQQAYYQDLANSFLVNLEKEILKLRGSV